MQTLCFDNKGFRDFYKKVNVEDLTFKKVTSYYSHHGFACGKVLIKTIGIVTTETHAFREIYTASVYPFGNAERPGIWHFEKNKERSLWIEMTGFAHDTLNAEALKSMERWLSFQEVETPLKNIYIIEGSKMGAFLAQHGYYEVRTLPPPCKKHDKYCECTDECESEYFDTVCCFAKPVIDTLFKLCVQKVGEIKARECAEYYNPKPLGETLVEHESCDSEFLHWGLDQRRIDVLDKLMYIPKELTDFSSIKKYIFENLRGETPNLDILKFTPKDNFLDVFYFES